MTSTITLISVTQAAQILAVHPATIRRMIGRGELPAKRVGRVWRVDPADLQPERRELQGTKTRQDRVIAGPLARFVLRGSRHSSATRFSGELCARAETAANGANDASGVAGVTA